MSAVAVRSELDVDAACALFDLDEAALVERFSDPPLLGHWFAYGPDDTPLGVATVTERPDGRAFLVHRLVTEEAWRPLLDVAVVDSGRTLHVTVSGDHPDRVAGLRSLGFDLELESTGYDVRFDRALGALRSSRRRASCEILPVDEVAPDELFDLDTALRGDAPGNDGWQGRRSWFDEELSSPECDPTGYLIAVDQHSGELIGLCRMWRNPAGPTLGMLGVRRDRRQGFVALELLRQTLRASSGWGFTTFSTHTARAGLQRHLDRVGAAPTGGFRRFVRAERSLSSRKR